MQTLNLVSLKSTNTQHGNKHMHRATILRKLHTHPVLIAMQTWPAHGRLTSQNVKWKEKSERNVIRWRWRWKKSSGKVETEITAHPYRGSHSGRLVLPAYMPAFDSMSLWILSIGPVGVQAGVRGSQWTQMQSLSQTHIHKLSKTTIWRNKQMINTINQL